MAAVEGLSPALQSSIRRMSSTTSLQSSDLSKDLPRSTTRLSFSLHYWKDGPPPSPLNEGEVKIEDIEDEGLRDPKVGTPAVACTKERETCSCCSSSEALAKRPRGRPRKHPQIPPCKAPKGRSKTGCITCRRRKKKCDENKPACLHCQKNNVHCEGYSAKNYWQSGKQRSITGRTSSIDRPRELPPLIDGIETETDWLFFNHYNVHLSRVLSLFTENHNPFKEILLPMATMHRGLMHSILCLSGTHLITKEPNDQFEQRQLYHFSYAVTNLSANLFSPKIQGEDPVFDDPTVAQVLVLCLKSICAGETHGEYRAHLDAARSLISSQPSTNPEFRTFLLEFFVYHDVSNSITSLDRPSVLMSDDYHLPDFMEPETCIFLGVADGLFVALSKATSLRKRVRARRTAGLKPAVDYQILADAQLVDRSLRNWVCQQPPDTPRYLAAFLYRHAVWVYLQRTIMPSRPNPRLRDALEEGLHYLRDLPDDSPPMSIVLVPLFILGVSAFDPDQRPEIRNAFDALQAYSNLGNIKYARMAVEKVWELMDVGDEDSWDWEAVMKSLGWDFLVT